MQPSLWTDMAVELQPPAALHLLGEAGFDRAELSRTHEQRYLEEAHDEAACLSAIQQAVDSSGVQLVQMHGYTFNCCRDDWEEGVARAARSLERAAALGIQWVVFHPGHHPLMGADPDYQALTRRRNLESFKRLTGKAEELDVGLAIENMRYRGCPRFGTTTDDLLWLLDQLGSEHVGICWDTGHANIAGVDQGAAIRAVGDHLVALHANDNDGTGDLHLAPGRGTVDWQQVMDGLKAVDYSGPFNLEVSGERRATPMPVRIEQARYLRALAQHLISF